MLKITHEYNFIGSTVVFNNSMGDEEYDEYNGMQFIVKDIFFDHSTFEKGDEIDPMLYPMIKIEDKKNGNIRLNAYCDEIGTQPFIDIFCYGIQSGSRFSDAFKKENNISLADISLNDFSTGESQYNPFKEGSFEYQLFKKGFECMYFKL